MAMNREQLKGSLSITHFMARYGTEAECRLALFCSRWPKWYCWTSCARYLSSWFWHEGQPYYYQYRACRHQTGQLSGTVLEVTKLPLTTWFPDIYLLTSTKVNMAALELKPHIGVSYHIAWRLRHKVMEAMVQREAAHLLKNFVQIDHTYRGSERNGGKLGHDLETKEALVIAAETDANLQHSAFAVIKPVRTFDQASITDWAQRHFSPESEAFSDGPSGYRHFEVIGCVNTVHESEGSRGFSEVDGARWANNMLLSNLKRSIGGAYHTFRQHKYARRYLAEAAYRCTCPSSYRNCCALWCSAHLTLSHFFVRETLNKSWPVIPANAGIQCLQRIAEPLDTSIRWDDGLFRPSLGH